MSLTSELDTWAAGIATATGLKVTRDPAKVYPPCVYLGLPDVTAGTLPAIAVQLPVYLVAGGSGKQAGDQLLDNLLALLDATEQTTASASVLNVDGTDFHAYLITARLHITL